MYTLKQLHSLCLRLLLALGKGLHHIPKCHIGEAEEETQCATKLSHQGGEGVQQLLTLLPCKIY